MFKTTYKVVNKRSGMKKRPAKRTDRNHNPMVSKMLQLKYRINDYAEIFGKTDETKQDRDRVFQLIQDARDENLSKDSLTLANDLWRTYEIK